MNDDIALTIAQRLVKEHEGCYLVAYPDPLSPLARALRERGITEAMVGRGHGIPDDLRHLSGRPWTIGHGQTGPGIDHGTVWSRQQADDALSRTLSRVLAEVKAVWPGSGRLHPKAQAAVISLVYNRGASLTKRASDRLDRRREMRELRPAIMLRDYAEMARCFRSMKRLWQGMGMAGLLKRREDEAKLCDEAAIAAERA